MLRGDTHFGISLQTLDDKAFDHGIILRQTAKPGIAIPAAATVSETIQDAAAKGSEMLVQGLRDGLHLPPHVDAGWKADEIGNVRLCHAAKVTKAEGKVNWTDWSPMDWVRRTRVLGSVWTMLQNNKGDYKRVIFLDAQISEDVRFENWADIASDDDFIGSKTRVANRSDGSCLFRLKKGCVRVGRIKVDGRAAQDATTALRPFIAQ